MGEGIRIGGGGKSEGLNVWKKGSSNLNFKTVISGVNNYQVNPDPSYANDTLKIKIQSSNSEIPISGLTASDLIGLIVVTNTSNNAGNNVSIRIDSSTKLSIQKGYDSWVSNYSYTFYPSTGIITTSCFISTTAYIIKRTSQSVTVDKSGTPLCFIVDDDANAYPNSGYHTDGYWYELFGSISSANVASLSNNVLKAVQADYREQIVSEVSQA